MNAHGTIKSAISSLPNVTTLPHRFGGTEFRYNKRELGHIHAFVPESGTAARRHGYCLVDIPFPMPVRNKLIEEGRVHEHHILPESGWISFYIRAEKDINEAIELLKMSYDIAVASKRKRNTRE